MDDGKMAQDVRGDAVATEVAAAAADVRADARPAGAPEAARHAADGADAARERLTSADVSVFCEGMAMMLAAAMERLLASPLMIGTCFAGTGSSVSLRHLHHLHHALQQIHFLLQIRVQGGENGIQRNIFILKEGICPGMGMKIIDGQF